MCRFAYIVSTTFAVVILTGGAGASHGAAVEVIRVPDGGTYPQAQVDRRGRIHLAYVKGDPARADCFYVRSDDAGKTFSKPVRVNSHPRSVIITGTVRGPHLAVGRAGRVHVAWMGSDEARPRATGRATPMLYTRLNDAGDAFEPQRNLIQKRPGLDGGGSVATDGEGNVYVAWHAPDGAEGEENRNVWVTRSRDDGKTFAAETAALPRKSGVCGCCGMRIHAAEGGKVFVVFRSAHDKVNRDIHLLASDDHGITFRVAAVDPWSIGTCVMSTASLANAPTGLVAAWETKQQVRLATSAAPHGAAVVGVASDQAGVKHPSIAANQTGEYLVAWAVGTGWNKGGSLAWQVFDNERQPVAAMSGHRDGLPVWSVPAALAMPDGSFKLIY